MIDSLNIVLGILTILFGGANVFAFFTIKEIKRKQKAEAATAETNAQSGNVTLVEGTVNTMIKTVNSLMNQNKELIDAISLKTNECERLKDEKQEIEERFEELDKKVTRMIQTNMKVIRALEALNVDPKIIDQLKEAQNSVSSCKKR